MGKGIDLAREDAPLHAAMLDDFKDQLLVTLLRRLADEKGHVQVPVQDVDDNGGFVVAFAVDPVTRVFNFEVRKKQ